MTTTNDLTRLYEIAKAATPGPWIERDSYGSVSFIDDDGDVIIGAAPLGCENSSVDIDETDSLFLTTCHPGVVMGLIVRTLKAESSNRRLRKAMIYALRTFAENGHGAIFTALREQSGIPLEDVFEQ